MIKSTLHPPDAMYKEFPKKLDIDGDGKIWTRWEAFCALSKARKEAAGLRKQGAPWGKKGAKGDFNVRILEMHLYHVVYYRRRSR